MKRKNGGGVLRVLVATTSSVRRNGLEAIVQENPALQLAGSATGILGLPERVRDLQPDVVLIDLAQPDTQFSSSAAAIQQSGSALVALVDGANASWISRALRTGVHALLAREASAAEIYAAIQCSAKGLVLLDPEIARELATHGSPDNAESVPEMVENLTPREVEVLRMMAEGLGNKEIALRLGISDHTVKFHISSILAKLGAASRTEAVTMGIRMGLIML